MQLHRLLIIILLALLSACAKQQAAKQNADQYQSYMRVANKLHAANDDETAQIFYQRAEKANPRAQQPKLKLAKIANKQGDYVRAQQYFHAILAANPNAMDAKLGLTNTYIEQNNIELAIVELKKMPTNDSMTTKIDNSVGVLLDKVGAHWSAQKCYLRGLRKDPAGEFLWNNIATSYLLASDYKKSLEVLDKLKHFPSVSMMAEKKYNAINDFLSTRSQLPADKQKLARQTLIKQFAPHSPQPDSVQLTKSQINQLRAMCT